MGIFISWPEEIREARQQLKYMALLMQYLEDEDTVINNRNSTSIDTSAEIDKLIGLFQY